MSDTYKTKTLDLKIKIEHTFDHDSDVSDIGTLSASAQDGAIDRWHGVVLGAWVSDIREANRIILSEDQLKGCVDFDKATDYFSYSADWDKLVEFVNSELKKRNIHVIDGDEDVSSVINKDLRTVEISYEGYVIIGHCEKEHTDHDRRFFVSENYDYEGMMEWYLTNHTHQNVEGSPTQRIIDYDDNANPIVYTKEQAIEKVVEGILAGYKVVRSWYNNDWHYFGINATVEDEDGNELESASSIGFSNDMEDSEIEREESDLIWESVKKAIEAKDFLKNFQED